jgi:hypothetical protein
VKRDYAIEADLAQMFIHDGNEYEIFALKDKSLTGGYVIEATKNGKPFVMGPQDQLPARIRYLVEPDDISDFEVTHDANLVRVLMNDYSSKIREFC